MAEGLFLPFSSAGPRPHSEEIRFELLVFRLLQASCPAGVFASQTEGPCIEPAEQQAAFIDMYAHLPNALGAAEAVYFADPVHSAYQAKPSHGQVKVDANPAVTPTVDGGNAAQLLPRIEARNPDNRLIHLIQQPPDCPHLNPIERLWAVKRLH